MRRPSPEAHQVAEGRAPSVSVVIPVRNEARSIGAALRSVLEQDYPGLVEVVVADGMSSDGTREIVEEAASLDPRVRLIDNPAGTTPAGLNAAIRASSGEIVARVDAHAVLPPGYLERSVQLLQETGADNVGGIQAAAGRTFTQRAVARAMSIRMGVGDARFHLGGPPGPVDTVYLGVFRREALDRVGLFDEDLRRNQDADLNHRIRASGGTVWFSPELRVRYEPRSSLAALWRQYWASGAWKRETFRRRPGSMRLRQLAPPFLVLGLLASALLAVLGPDARLGLVLPAIYAAALALTALWNLVRHAEPSALLLPLVLPTMHLGWGLGFLLGRPRVAAPPPDPDAPASGPQRVTARVREIVERRQVLGRLIGEDLKVKYESSVLGYVWSVLEPLMLTGVYFFVFRVIGRFRVPDYPLFLITGILAWTWFQATVTGSSRALTSNAKLITKVYVPREIFPLSVLGAKAVEYLFSLLVLVMFALGIRRSPSGYLVYFPLAIAMQAMLLAGIGMALSAMNTLLRDVERVIRPFMRAAFYLTPIVYPLTLVPEQFRIFTAINPLTGIMELYHAAFFPELFGGWHLVQASALGSVVIFLSGWALFVRLEPAILKEL